MEAYKEHHRKFVVKKVRFAIITVSTSRFKLRLSKGKVKDVSGDLAEKMIKEAGYDVVYRNLVPDDIEKIRNVLKNYKDKVDCIIFIGGTGLSPSDVTPEAIEPLLEKKLPGFGELFRMISYQEIGPPAMISRAFAGVYGKTVIFALPGSAQAVKMALEKLILPEIAHIVWLCRQTE